MPVDVEVKIGKHDSLYEGRFLELTSIFLDSIYPHCIKLKGDKHEEFILNALAYSDSCIISAPLYNSLSSLKIRINNDIKTLQKVKHPSVSLIYLVDNSLFPSNDKIVHLNSVLSKNGYRVIIYSDLMMEDILIRSFRQTPLSKEVDLKSLYASLYASPKVQQSVIEEIFSFVNSDLINEVEVKPFEKNYLHLKLKVEKNFSGRFYKEVRGIFNSNWSNKTFVEFFIKQNFHRYESQFYTILGLVRNKFKTVNENSKGITDFPVNDPAYFEMLAQCILPAEKQNEPRYLLAANAIILFFFEYCDFGRKTVEDPPTLFTKLDAEDDSTD